MLILGFLLGMRHATDPDHVVAVTTIVAREKRVWASAIIGAWWGLGHTVTIFAVGGALIAFHLVIPPRLGLAMESAVALMLVGLGITTLTGARRRGRTGAPHLEIANGSNLRSLFVGVVHGLAGSAAIALLILVVVWALVAMALAQAPTIRDNSVLSVAYYVIAGLGWVLPAMPIVSWMSRSGIRSQ